MHLETIRRTLDLYSAYYKDTTLLRDSNAAIKDIHMQKFVNWMI